MPMVQKDLFLIMVRSLHVHFRQSSIFSKPFELRAWLAVLTTRTVYKTNNKAQLSFTGLYQLKDKVDVGMLNIDLFLADGAKEGPTRAQRAKRQLK